MPAYRPTTIDKKVFDYLKKKYKSSKNDEAGRSSQLQSEEEMSEEEAGHQRVNVSKFDMENIKPE